MAINKISTIAALIIIYVASTSLTCNKRIGCSDLTYSFSINIKAYPDDDVLYIGDTLWIEAQIPVTLTDNGTGQTIKFSDAQNLGTSINYDELLGNHDLISCASCFEYVLVNGDFIHDDLNTLRNKDYRFYEESDLYLFKLGIIPKKKGIFKLSVGNANNVYRKNDKCTKAFFEISFGDTNQHLYLYQQNRPGYVLSEYDKSHTYAFKVE